MLSEEKTNSEVGSIVEILNPFERVRKSCALIATKYAKHVKFNEEGLKQFVETYFPTKDAIEELKLTTMNKSVLPFKFQSIDHEINYRVLYGLLQLGSGFRKLLHAKVQRGAADTIVRGLINCLVHENIDIQNLGVDMMEHVAESNFQIEQNFQFPVKEEVPHEKYSVIKVQQDSALKSFAENIKSVLKECSRKLRERMCQDFAQFVRKMLQEYERKKEKGTNDVKDIGPAAYLVNQLVNVFPNSLNDIAQYKTDDGEVTVYLYKKAQLIVSELYINIKDQDPLFDFSDINDLTIFVDNVIPATLVKAGVLEIIDENLKHKIEEGTFIKHGSTQEIELRAISIYATERILEVANQPPLSAGLNAVHIDMFLWGDLGKREGFRAHQRHATIDTLYY
ncbi:hypothetical protein ABK040_006447 [Willaertia magna]